MESRSVAFPKVTRWFASCMRWGPRKTGRGTPTPCPDTRGRTYCEARDRWLVKPIRTTQGLGSQFVSTRRVARVRTECPHRRRARKDGNIREDDSRTESIASDAESYQRGSWRRPDPRITEEASARRAQAPLRHQSTDRRHHQYYDRTVIRQMRCWLVLEAAPTWKVGLPTGPFSTSYAAYPNALATENLRARALPVGA
jgi:hypothetical protein